MSHEVTQGRQTPGAVTVEHAERVLHTLVRARSTNGTEHVDGEVEVIDRVVELMEGTGVEVHRVPLPGFDTHRQSAAARLDGKRPGPTLVLNGHVDTVPVDNPEEWSVPPFEGLTQDGCLYGRGAADMKAGIAAQILCARALASSPVETRVPVVFHFAADEEQGGPGTTSLIDAGFTGHVGVCTEPTSLDVCVGMRGMTGYRITIKGRSAHVGYADRGRNPVSPGSHVLQALLEHGDAIRRSRVDPLVGPANCTPTVVRSGVEHCSIPDQFEIEADRRMIPGETQAEAIAELDQVVESTMRGFRGYTWQSAPLDHLAPASVNPDSEFVRSVGRAAERVSGRKPSFGATPFASDVTHLIHHGGIDAVTFGPGDCSLAHAADEHAPLDEVVVAAEALIELAQTL